ncbi:MAG TPA: phosphodiester glycosidase family protein [Jatrophihabitans sp.]
MRTGTSRNSNQGNRATRWLAVIAVLVVAMLSGTAAVQAEPAARQHSRSTAERAPWNTPGYSWTQTLHTDGLAIYAGTLSRPEIKPYWTITIQAPATSSLTGNATTSELGSATWAQQTAQALRADSQPARTDAIRWPDSYTDTPHGIQGYRVRTGAFTSQTDAQSEATVLKADGFSTSTVEWTGYDSDQPMNGEQVHVAVIDPRRLDGSVAATHGNAIATRTPVSQLASASGASVAVNGGYFITADADGFQGAPSGLAAYQGKLQAMSVGDRAALVLGEHNDVSIQHLVSTVVIQAGRAAHQVDGLNRKPGLVRDCGRVGLQPTSEPRQDFTCTSADDTVLFTAQFGASLPVGVGSQATLDSTGRVLSVGARGGSVPAGGSAVQAIGGSASWLTSHLVVGSRVRTHEQIRDDRTGRQVDVSETRGIVSAGPTLVQNGRTAIDAATEGVIDPADLSFNYAWGEIRQPRTMAGIDASGRLLLVTVDGRETGISAGGTTAVSDGVTLAEGAQLMRELGARQAMNLDGGGSTAMAINGQLVNHPSDPTGERADGDAIVVTLSR